MPKNILMPALSPTMKEGSISKWLKQEGEKVEPGDVLAEIETDKAIMEVEAVDRGILGQIIVPGGSESVQVNDIIGVIIGEKEDDIGLLRFALGSGCCCLVFGDQRACREAGEQRHGDAIACVESVHFEGQSGASAMTSL